MARRWVRATGFFLLVAACTPTTDNRPAPPPISTVAPVRLSVGSVEVASDAQYPTNMNFIGRRRSELLAENAQNYLRSRLEAVGGADVAKATVVEATIIERAPDNPGGVLSTQPSWEMVGALALKVAIVDGFGVEQGFASSRVQITRSISPRMGVEAKDNFSRTLSNDLIEAAGRELMQSIDRNLADRRAF
ncbi:MAG: hypothetical protein WAS21_14550 [Geminicoccaceae bacterium]